MEKLNRGKTESFRKVQLDLGDREFAMYLCILNSNKLFRLRGGMLKGHLFFEKMIYKKIRGLASLGIEPS